MKDTPPTQPHQNIDSKPKQPPSDVSFLNGSRTSIALLLPGIEPHRPLRWSALEYRCRYKNEPCEEAEVRELAKQDPAGALEYSNLYAHEPWAEPIITLAAEGDPNDEKDEGHPEEALRFSYHYKTQKWAFKVVEKAALRRPFKGVDFADRYSDQGWAKDILLQLARIISRYLLNNSAGFMNEPWFNDVRQEAETWIKVYESAVF